MLAFSAFGIRFHESHVKGFRIGAQRRQGCAKVVGERGQRRLVGFAGLRLGLASAKELGAQVVESPGEGAERVRPLITQRRFQVTCGNLVGEAFQSLEGPDDGYVKVGSEPHNARDGY